MAMDPVTIVGLIYTGVATVVAAINGYTSFRNNLKAKNAQGMVGDLKGFVASLAATIDTVPMDEKTRKSLKGSISEVINSMNSNTAVFTDIVAEITDIAKQIQSNRQDETAPISAELAKDAVAEYNARQAAKTPKQVTASIAKAVATTTGCLFLVCALTSCAGTNSVPVLTPSLVSYTITPATSTEPPRITIKPPAIASQLPEQYEVFVVHGQLVIVAPIQVPIKDK